MKKLALIAILGIGATIAQGAVLTAPNADWEPALGDGRMADGRIRGGSSPSGITDHQNRCVLTSAASAYRDEPNVIFVLPDIGGESIASANLSLYGIPIPHGSQPATRYSSGDLYGLRYQANDTNSIADTDMLSSDAALSSTFSVSGNNGTGIMDNFFPPGTNISLQGWYETDATADVSLGAWLQSLYDDGAQAGDYVFLRISPDTDIYTYIGWNVMMADSPTNQPALTINTVPGAVAPTALFSASPTNGFAPLTVTFTDSSGGTITNRFWDFGDGATLNTTNTVVQHTYTSAGSNSVQLIASGPAGASTNTQTDVIVVTPAVAPTASFSAGPLSGYVPVVVTFTDNSSGSITNRFWDFGDGTTSNTTATSVEHTYTNSGTWTVQLTTSGPLGTDTDTQIDLITTEILPPGTIVLENAVREATTSQWADGRLRTGSSPTGQGDLTSRGVLTTATGWKHDSPMLVFVLPDLGGDVIQSANLSAYGTTISADIDRQSALDLYGVRYATNTAATSDSEMLATDEALSPVFSVSGNNGVGIMNDFFPPSTNASLNGTYETDATADAALGAWIQAQYDAGAQAGDYIFLRLTPDQTLYAYRGWNVTMADSASNQPKLTITAGAGASIGDVTIEAVGSDVMISWDAFSAYSYALQYKLSLTDALWLNYTNGIPGVDGPLSVTVPADQAASFYRSVIE